MTAVPALDLHKAILALWSGTGLDDEFKTFWSVQDQARYLTIHETEAQPNQPWPYCVYQIQADTTVFRMSAGGISQNPQNRNEIRNTICLFSVHAQKDGATSAKQRVSDLVAKIMEVFGGHPTVAPSNNLPSLTNGAVVKILYVSGFGVLTGDEEYQFDLTYEIQTDLPMAD